MEVTKEKIEDQNYLVKVKLETTDYVDKVEKKLKDYKKKSALKGFRPGHAPIGLIKKMYGPQITADEIDHILKHAFNDFVKDEKIDLIGEPIINADSFSNFDFANPGEVKVTYEIGVAPDINISYNGSPVSRYEILIDDELINQNLDELRKRTGSLEASELIEEDGYVTFQIEELNESGEVLEGGVTNNKMLPVKDIKNEKIRQDIQALKNGERIDINIFDAYENDETYIGAHVLNIDAAAVAEIPKNFRFTVKEIKAIKPAELNQEFFDKVLGPGNAADENEFLEKYKEILGQNYQNVSKDKMFSDVVEKLKKETNVPLPDNFLKKWMEKNKKEGVSEEELNDFFGEYTESIKVNLLLNKVLNENNVEIGRNDFDNYVNGYLSQMFGGIDAGTLNSEPFLGYKQNLLQNQKFVDQAFGEVRKQKLIELFDTKFKFETKSIKYTDFIDLINQSKAEK